MKTKKKKEEAAMYFLIQPYHSLVKFKCGLITPLCKGSLIWVSA